MATELECKLPLQDRAAVVSRLRELGAQETPAVHERNWTFDTPEKTLYAARMLLRVRQLNDDPQAVLTVKRPLPEARFKRREEVEITTPSVDAARLFLETLGYAPDWFYEKIRQHWQYDGCEIVLDTLPEIGEYLEIEGADEDTIHALLERLGLNPDDHVPLNYRGIFEQHRRARGLPPGEMRFEAFGDTLNGHRERT